jgi:hypothetical protein
MEYSNDFNLELARRIVGVPQALFDFGGVGGHKVPDAR